MVSVKMGLELVLELVAETLKTKNRENLTFWKFYFFLKTVQSFTFLKYDFWLKAYLNDAITRKKDSILVKERFFQLEGKYYGCKTGLSSKNTFSNQKERLRELRSERNLE